MMKFKEPSPEFIMGLVTGIVLTAAFASLVSVMSNSSSEYERYQKKVANCEPIEIIWGRRDYPVSEVRDCDGKKVRWLK